MCVTKRTKQLLAALALTLWVTSAHADCTKSPLFVGAIAGDNANTAGDLDLYANFSSQCAAIDFTAAGRIRLHERLDLSDTWTLSAGSSSFFINLAPTITASYAQSLVALRLAGSTTQTTVNGGTGGATVINVIDSNSATTKLPAIIGGFTDVSTITCNNAACGSSGAVWRDFDDQRAFQVLGASGSMTLTGLTTLRSAPAIATDTAGGAVTLSARRGFDCQAPGISGAGTNLLTDNVCIDLAEQSGAGITNHYGVRSAITSGAAKYFLKDDGGAQSKLTGKFTTYNATTTAGYGLATVVAAGRFTAQTAAKASVATFTVGASDGTFRVSANVLVTTSTVHSFTVTCAYTDEGNTARTITLNFSTLAGVISNAGIANAAGAVPYAGVPLHIRAKSGTAITIATTGTFTTVTYNVEGLIEQLA